MNNADLFSRLCRYFREGLDTLHEHRHEPTVYTRLRWLRQGFRVDTGMTIHEAVAVLENAEGKE